MMAQYILAFAKFGRAGCLTMLIFIRTAGGSFFLLKLCHLL